MYEVTHVLSVYPSFLAVSQIDNSVMQLSYSITLEHELFWQRYVYTHTINDFLVMNLSIRCYIVAMCNNYLHYHKALRDVSSSTSLFM